MTDPDVTYALLGAADAISDHAFTYVSDQTEGVDFTITFCKNCGGDLQKRPKREKKLVTN